MRGLNDTQRVVLSIQVAEEPVPFEAIASSALQLWGGDVVRVRRALRELERRHYIKRRGKGRRATYSMVDSRSILDEGD